jgi:hypothetical protein
LRTAIESPTFQGEKRIHELAGFFRRSDLGLRRDEQPFARGPDLAGGGIALVER